MFQFASSYENNLSGKTSRIESIDVLRGIVMALMALDHCRDYFHRYAFNYSPEDLNYTTPIVFYTRWITHFCAPVFVLLTGLSAFLYQQKNKATHKQLAHYLIVRGLILILLELTIVRFAWRFYIDYSSIGGLVLWAIGWSMIALAGLIYLPRRAILIISLAIIFGHNFLDAIVVKSAVTGNGIYDFFAKLGHLSWSFLHQKAYVPLTDDFGVHILYPVLPMIGVIGFGFWLGKWFTYEYSSEIRAGYLFYLGLIVVSLFFGIRALQLITEQYSYLFYLKEADLASKWTVMFKDVFGFMLDYYGDPSPWQVQENFTYTLLSLFNTTKYPMSLLYILMTLGPALMVLSWLENKNNVFTRIMKVYGKVPLFYYMIHLFLIHGLAILVAVLTHLDKIKEVLGGDWQSLSENYGFSMPMVYLVWLFVLALLYPACSAYGKLKSQGRYKLLSYL